ncbi:hypothetical protein [Vibrio metschnikovii]|uniref:VapA family S-layer protein n=1 Tax=Vibrio metschnikovii TaxID=28172 RepID=UPI002FC82393
MFKKTLLAVAVASLASTSAFAMDLTVTKDGAAAFSTNVIAVQTKQEVLDKTTLEGVIDVRFDNSGVEKELKDAGELILRLTGDAQFNPEKVAALLSVQGAADIATADFTSALQAVVGADSAAIDDVNLSNLGEELEKIFKIDFANNVASIRYSLDSNNQRLSIKLADTVDPANLLRVRFDFTKPVLGQAFRLTSGTTSQVRMTVGALQNQSFTADPQPTPVLFKTDNLFKVTQTNLVDGKDATALVSETYTKWATTDAQNHGVFRGVTFFNNSTKQNIQHQHVKLSLVGDFTGIATKNGKLVDDAGAETKWSVANGTASVTYSSLTAANDNFPGTDNDPAYAGVALDLPKFIIDENNDKGLEAQSFALKVEVIDNATFNPYAQQIGNAFVVVRDGMKFDTVTTGTTAQNVIYIRDVSKTLPAEGGKIFVTITEYDAHELENGGKGTDLITRAVLPTRLPSNGAVTLTPAGIAEALGVATTPARQARFFFEIETNQGEAAVKKQTSEGVDIQTGRKQDVTDFTL